MGDAAPRARRRKSPSKASMAAQERGERWGRKIALAR